MKSKKIILKVLIAAFLCQPVCFARSAAGAVNSADGAPRWLAPKSFAKKEPSKKPLRENLTPEEIQIYKMYELLEEINLRIYSALLSRTHVKRQLADLEKRIAKGEKGLGPQKTEFQKGVQKWTGQIESDVALLKKIRDEFPAPAENESLLRTKGREFLDRAIVFMSRKRIPAGDVLLASAKVEVLKEFNEMVSRHLKSRPSQLAHDIMVEDRFGRQISTLTIDGFGIKVMPRGNVVAPQQFYTKDVTADILALKWKNINLDGLPAALRQKAHIQESEANEYEAVVGFIKAIEDIKNQTQTAIALQEQLTGAQCDTMTRLLLLIVLRMNPQGFQKMVSEQAEEVEWNLKRILSANGVRGEKREAIVKKGVQNFRRIQDEIATAEENLLSWDKRTNRQLELADEWHKTLRKDMEEMEIDHNTVIDVHAEVFQLGMHALIDDTAELIVRLDPYGQIKDPHKRNALLLLRIAMELMSVGRIDRNVPDLLDAAQASLYLRLANAKRIREAVERQEAALRAELLERAARDREIDEAMDTVQRNLRSRDAFGALKIATGLFNKHFSRSIRDNRMAAVKRALIILINQCANLRPLQKDIGTAVKVAREIKGTIMSLEKQIEEAMNDRTEIQYYNTSQRRRALPQAADHLAAARKRLNGLKTFAQSKTEKKLPSNIGVFLQGLPQFSPEAIEKSGGLERTANGIDGVRKRLEIFLLDDFPPTLTPDMEKTARAEIAAAMGDLKMAVDRIRASAAMETDARKTKEEMDRADEKAAALQKRLDQSRARQRALWAEVPKAKEIFDMNRGGAIKTILLVKRYIGEESLPMEEHAKPSSPHAFFDSARFRMLKERLAERGVPEGKIEEFIFLLEKLRGPARYEGGAIHTDEFLLKLDAEVSRLAGLPEKSFFMLAREILYHELVHEYLSGGEGQKMVLERVINYPGYDQLKTLLSRSYLGGAVDALTDELYAQEAVAKLASLLFEGEASTSVMDPSLREALMKFKDLLKDETTFRALTADGIDALGDQSAQKKVFHMLKAVLEKQEERLTKKSSRELDNEAQGQIAALKKEIEAVLRDIKTAIYAVGPAATTARDINSDVQSATGVNESK